MRLSIILIAVFSLFAFTCADKFAFAQQPSSGLLEHQTKPLEQAFDRELDTREHPPFPKEAPDSKIMAPDLTGVWYHLGRADLSMALAELARLEHDNPSFSPPVELVAAIRLLAARQALAANEVPRPEELSALLDALIPCDDPASTWKLVEMDILANSTLAQMSVDCSDPDVAFGALLHYLQPFPQAEWAALVARLQPEDGWPSAMGERVERLTQQLEDRRYAAIMSSLSEATSINDHALSEIDIAEAGRLVRERSDAQGAIVLGWANLQRNEPAEARKWFELAREIDLDSDYRQGLGLSLSYLSQQAVNTDDINEAFALALEASSVGHEDALEILGWKLLDSAKPEDAAKAFVLAPATESATYGQVLALRAAGKHEDAQTLACDAARISLRLAGSCSELLSQEMAKDFAAGRYESVPTIWERREALSQIWPDLDTSAFNEQRSLLAWSFLRSGQPEQAGEVFDGILAHDPMDESAAIGLLESLQKAGDSQTLASAKLRHPELARKLRKIASDRAFARKQFDLAGRLSDHKGHFAGRDSWAVRLGTFARITSGDSGLSRLSFYDQRVGASGMIGETRLDVAVSGVILDSGRPLSSAAFGSRPAPDKRTPLDSVTGLSPYLAARHEQEDVTFFGEFSLSPLLGPVDATPLGELGTTIFYDPASTTFRLFARSMSDSLLSRVGVKDPASDRTFGRVVDYGVGFQQVLTAYNSLSFALTGEAGHLNGKGVAGNDRVFARWDVAWDFASNDALPELAHLRLGPFVSWQSFRRNLNHFTYGHGGYYSPHKDLRGGLRFDIQSGEGKPWLIRANSSLAVSHVENDSAPRFPKSDSFGGEGYSSSRKTGYAADAVLQGMWLARSRLLMGGFVGYSAAPDYSNVFFGLSLTIPFSDRSGIVSADLPVPEMFKPY